MRFNPSSSLLVLVACVSLAACDKKVADSQADAVRNTSDAAATDIENKAEAAVDATKDQADAIRDRGEKKADAIEAGTVGATTKTDTMTTTTEPKPN